MNASKTQKCPRGVFVFSSIDIMRNKKKMHRTNSANKPLTCPMSSDPKVHNTFQRICEPPLHSLSRKKNITGQPSCQDQAKHLPPRWVATRTRPIAAPITHIRGGSRRPRPDLWALILPEATRQVLRVEHYLSPKKGKRVKGRKKEKRTTAKGSSVQRSWLDFFSRSCLTKWLICSQGHTQMHLYSI